MSLRDEIQTMINRRSQSLPLALEAAHGDPGEVSFAELAQMIAQLIAIDREAILRLADEIDKLKA